MPAIHIRCHCSGSLLPLASKLGRATMSLTPNPLSAASTSITWKMIHVRTATSLRHVIQIEHVSQMQSRSFSTWFAKVCCNMLPAKSHPECPGDDPSPSEQSGQVSYWYTKAKPYGVDLWVTELRVKIRRPERGMRFSRRREIGPTQELVWLG